VLRHEFRPGKLVAGLFLLGTGIAYIGDAGGAWETPPLVLIPVVAFGLALAAVAAAVGYSVRRRRSARAASIENTEAPASISGSQAMR
jgi:drug/metabolite transporter (DMT)-like permease